jgi:AcrR family transcriptional regulator
MARTRNDELHELRRSQILSAAARVFKEKGFHGARTEDICAQAGMSAGAVFRYFRDKREIIDAIVKLESERYAAQCQHLFTREGLLQLASVSDAELERTFWPGEFDLSLDSWLEIARGQDQPRMLELDQQLRTAFAELLCNGQREGWVRPDLSPRSATGLMFALVNGLWLELSLGIPVNSVQAAAAIRDFVTAYLFSSQPEPAAGN